MKYEGVFICVRVNRYEKFTNFDILSGNCLIFIY